MHKGSYTRLMSIMLIVDTNPSEHYAHSGYKPRCPYWVHLLLVVLITKFMEQGSCKYVLHDCLPSSGINQFFTCIIFCLWLSKASCNVRLTWLDDSCCRQSVEECGKIWSAVALISLKHEVFWRSWFASWQESLWISTMSGQRVFGTAPI